MWCDVMSDSWQPELSSWTDKFPDLVWWLDLNDRKIPRGSIEVATRPLLDNTTGLVWDMRIDHRGIPVGPLGRDHDGFKGTFKEKRTELKYENWQYELIVWCLLKMIDEQWRSDQCYHVIKHFWKNLSGQPPLTVATVTSWWRTHLGRKREGILWP